MNGQTALIAWHVSERGDKKFWTRLGAAWNHEDGEGMTLQLDLMPVAGGVCVALVLASVVLALAIVLLLQFRVDPAFP